MPENKPQTRRMSAIRPANKADFGNKGIAHVKRVGVVDDVEVVFIEEIPITTARFDTTRRLFAPDRSPKPPVETKLVAAASEDGKALGFTKDTLCTVPRLDDTTYRMALEEWSEKMMWSLVAEAVDIELVFIDSSDNERSATSTEEKIIALKQAGYQQTHILEIMHDVQRIAAFTEEERRSFLGMS